APKVAFKGVRMPQPDDVLKFARDARFRSDFQAIIEVVRARFPSPGYELSLEVYRDPEIADRYLTLYVRTNQYSDQIMEEIDAISAGVARQFPKVRERLLITTD